MPLHYTSFDVLIIHQAWLKSDKFLIESPLVCASINNDKQADFHLVERKDKKKSVFRVEKNEREFVFSSDFD